MQIVLKTMRPGLTVSEAERICFEALIKAAPNRSPRFRAARRAGSGPEYRYGPGDLFFCDMGGSYRGYHADFARMASLGPASPELRRAHADICGIIDAVIDSMRPGVRCRDVAEVCNRELEPSAFPDCRAPSASSWLRHRVSGAAIAQRG